MHIVLELKRRLTSKENERILNEAGFDTDTELDYTDKGYDDLDYDYLQFLGDDDENSEKQIWRGYFLLLGMKLPAICIYIDDDSAAGITPKDHHPDCLWATPMFDVEPSGVVAFWGCDCGFGDYDSEQITTRN